MKLFLSSFALSPSDFVGILVYLQLSSSEISADPHWSYLMYLESRVLLDSLRTNSWFCDFWLVSQAISFCPLWISCFCISVWLISIDYPVICPVFHSIPVVLTYISCWLDWSSCLCCGIRFGCIAFNQLIHEISLVWYVVRLDSVS